VFTNIIKYYLNYKYKKQLIDMVKSILITKYLRKFLLDNQELQKVIRPTNIYPIIANQNTPFPYIVM